MPNPTETQWKIVQYAREHPGMLQKEIAKGLGLSVSYVSNTLVAHLPEVTKRGRGLTDKQREIIRVRNENPDMSQAAIARWTGSAESFVSETLHLPAKPARKRTYKKADVVTLSVDSTETRTCLGSGCTKKIPKDDYVHFCEQCQARRVYMQYIPKSARESGFGPCAQDWRGLSPMGMRFLTGREYSPKGIIGLAFVLGRSLNDDATAGVAGATRLIAEKGDYMWTRIPGGQSIPPKVWARATDVLADYARAGEAFVAAGRPKECPVAELFDKAAAEYNAMADAIWFAKWTKEQREEWERILR